MLLLKAAPAYAGGAATGGLVVIPANVQREVVAALEQSSPSARGAFLPLMLDTGQPDPGAWIGGVVAAALFLPALRNARKWLARRGAPERHPILLALARHGPVRETTLVIDAEAGQGARDLGGGATLTASWLLKRRLFGLTAVRPADVVWVYTRVTRHSLHFVPVGKSFTVVVCDRHGSKLEVPGSETQTVTTLREVLGQAPWAFGGYTKDLEAVWKRQRAVMIQAVDARRRPGAAPAR